MIQPYELPAAFETAEVAALLRALKPRARRALRSYMHQVEFGNLNVHEWLALATCPMKERNWYGIKSKPEFRTAFEAYKRAMQRAELDADAKAVTSSQRTLRRAADYAAQRLVEQAQSDIGRLFKTADRWTSDPLPSWEILDEEDREDPATGLKRRFYLVRQVVFDTASLRDSRARQIKKLSDSPRAGFSVEVYDAQRAVESILDRADPETATKAQGAGAGVVVVIPDNGRADRASTGAADQVSEQPG